MYFRAAQILKSIDALSAVHPFHGITYLACKENGLPVGNTVAFQMDSVTKAFLEQHHKVAPASSYYFQPFAKKKTWVRSDYASSGLQAINTQTFRDAFIHERGSRRWGWTADYVDVMALRLPQKKKIRLFDLAVWIYKDRDWPSAMSASEILKEFKKQFRISDGESKVLFAQTLPSDTAFVQMLGSKMASWIDLRPSLPPPPDDEPRHGGTLAYLETQGLGPAEQLILEPADRLTLITGDNGLGKSFLLECAWWALTGTWADTPAYPIRDGGEKGAKIRFSIEGPESEPEETTITFDWKALSWPKPKRRPTLPGLVVYARVDGSFAVWDPIRQTLAPGNSLHGNSLLSSFDVWNGATGKIEGLIRDWVKWQSGGSQETKATFETFTKVLDHLSPPDLGKLEPGDPMRIPGDARDIPTLRHRYGITPVVYESAGVRRVITLGYLVVWAWTEHLVAARQTTKPPEQRIVILVDEMEAHLHPRWQRVVLPALLSVAQALGESIEAQYIVATHSPLVMASAEPLFDEEIDSLVHLDLSSLGKVSLHELQFVKFGDVSNWLTSPVFGLRHARQAEADEAIEAAKTLQLETSPSRDRVQEVTDRLKKNLADDDRFWPRWISFAEKFGIKV